MDSIANWIIFILFITGITFVILKFKDDEESYYSLKIIGYYLLGIFRFSINKIHIPLGFIIYLTLLQNHERNQRGKRYAAILGLIGFVFSLIVPLAIEAYYERTQYMEPITTNIYEFDFQDHWKKVVQTIGIDENFVQTARIESLNIDYEKNGELRGLGYEVLWKEEGQFRHGLIDFHEVEKEFRIRVTKVEQWLQYDRLISAERLFEKLDQISIKDLTPKGDFSYYGFNFGGRDNFGIEDEGIFIIEDNKIVPYEGGLPIEGYWIVIFGMEQMEKNSYSSTDNHYYLFDVQY